MGLAHEEYVGTQAWVDGVAKALKERVLMGANDKTASVSLDHDKDGEHDLYDHEYFKLCKICGWNRKSDKCQCVEKGLV